MTYPPQPSMRPDPYEPPRRNRRVLVAIVVVGLLVVAGVAGYLLTNGDDLAASAPEETGNPGGGNDVGGLRDTAMKYVDAVNDAEEATAKDMMCDSSTAGILYEEEAGKGDVRAGDAELISETAGVVSITLANSETLSVPLAFEFTDGAWCVQF